MTERRSRWRSAPSPRREAALPRLLVRGQTDERVALLAQNARNAEVGVMPLQCDEWPEAENGCGCVYECRMREYRQQRLLRVTQGASIPSSWRFVQWVGKETNPITGTWEDVILCEFDEDWHS